MMLNSFVANSNAKSYTIDTKPAMSGQRPMPPQPQPFRFWLPYRSNVGSWRQQPRQLSSHPVPSSPQPQPPPPPSPTPAEPAYSRGHAVEDDIPIQAESSDESDAIPVQSSDSSQLRGGRPSMADLELTLSGTPPSPTGQEQSSGNDTKIAISGFPRSLLFDGARAPYRQEIEDGLKSLAGRGAPAAPRPENGQGYRVITLAGHNVGASMVVGSGGLKDAHTPAPKATEPEDPGSAARPPAVSANVNSNVQNVNNSSMEGSTCSTGNPGVHVDVRNGREEPAAAPRGDEKPKRRPPLVVPATTQEKSTAPTTAAAPARPRRCLRALMMENGSDTEAARNPKLKACRFQCVADHTPPAPTSNGGGAGGMNAKDGGKSSTTEAN